MRGEVESQSPLFFTLDVEELIRGDHPLRAIKKLAHRELAGMRAEFDRAYSHTGRPSIPPERLILSSLLQALYSIRSERELCEQIRYNLLFRWFVDLPVDAPVFDHSVFSKNRQRLSDYGLMGRFFDGVVAGSIMEQAATDEEFSVDGTLITAWGSMKAFQPKDAPDKDQQDPPESDSGPSTAPPKRDSNAWADFRGEKRSNATHCCVTDPEARLARKSNAQAAHLSHSMHALMENRHGLLMQLLVEEANGTAERDTAVRMLRQIQQRHGIELHGCSIGADKGYDSGPFLATLEEELKMVPHVASKSIWPTPPNSAKYRRYWEYRKANAQRTATEAYGSSQRKRRRIEEIFGWLKDVAQLRRTRFAGRWKIQLYAWAAGAAWNLLRLSKLKCALT